MFSRAKRRGIKIEKALCSNDFVVDIDELKELYYIYKKGKKN